MDLVVFLRMFRRNGGFFRGSIVKVMVFSWLFNGNGGFFIDFWSKLLFFSLIFRYLGVTLENEAYMLGLGGAKKRKW